MNTDSGIQDFFDKKIVSDKKDLPLAVKMRPKTLQGFVGQPHIIGEGKLLRRAIEADRLSSLILYGPSGCGKTSLAWCISNVTKSHFERINAVTSNVQTLRKAILQAKNRKNTSGRKTILFIDEIHRFNKAQQDVLLPDVEEGSIILIGATVHNPFFCLVSPLISRSLVFELKPLTEAEISDILNNTLKDTQCGLGNVKIKIAPEALKFLAKSSEGDARRAIGALEIGRLTTKAAKDGFIYFTKATVEELIQKKAVRYDRSEDAHYDTASAFIKSMRGSDPDATLYWMAKMLYAGEDPRFVARRICICAAEDVGNADPQAIVVSSAALQISEFVGLPECRIPLAQAAVYVATAPKSNASYLGIERAQKDIGENRTLEVPEHLKDSNYPGAEKLGHGKDYKYAHNFKNHFVEQDYIPQKRKYYEPSEQGYEKKIKERLDNLRKNK